MATFNLVPKATKPLEFENGLKFLSKLDGRDKSMRFVQYFSRYLAYQLKQSDPKSDLGGRLTLLYKALSLHRKAFRIGKFLDEYKKFMDALQNGQMEKLKRQMTMVLRACMTVFLMLDNLVWLASLKVLKYDKDPLKKQSYKFRLTAAFLNFGLVAMDFSKAEKKIQKLQKDGADSNEIESAKDKQGKNVVGLVKNTCDIITYGNSAKLISTFTGSDLNDGVVGILGAISAVAGGYSIWLKM